MTNTSKGAKKFAAKKLAEDPDYFKNLARRSRKPRGGKHSPGSFKKGNPLAAKGGKAGKRGPAKKVVTGSALADFKLEYEGLDSDVKG